MIDMMENLWAKVDILDNDYPIKCLFSFWFLTTKPSWILQTIPQVDNIRMNPIVNKIAMIWQTLTLVLNAIDWACRLLVNTAGGIG